MTVISNYSNNLFSKESALSFAGTVGAGLLSSRFLPISIKDAGVVSAAAGTLSTMGQALLAKDASPFKKSLLTIGAFALTYFGTAALAPTLVARFAITLTPQLIGKILAFNALGHVISFAVAKFIFVTPWNMSDAQITKLHETYSNDAELFTKLPAIEQQLVLQRFEKQELDVAAFTCQAPSEEEIAALTANEIRTLHQHEVVLEDDALLLRYFELDLSTFEALESRIPKLELKQPETVEEVKALSEEKLDWYTLYYAENDRVLENLPQDVQWALYEIGCTTSYSFNSKHLETTADAQIHDVMDSPSLKWWVGFHPSIQKTLVMRAKTLGIEIPHPVHPTTPEEVAALDSKVVEAYNEKFPDSLDKEVVKAFNQRFYELKLPLTNDLTIAKLQKNQKLKWPEISIKLPSTTEAVKQLDENQLPWLYASIRKNRGFHDLSFELQSALNVRFDKTLTWRHWFSFYKLTPENVHDASKETIEILHSQLNEQIDKWKELPAAVIGALDTRFAADFPADKLSEGNVRNYHIVFVTNPTCWNALTKARQQTLRLEFDKIPTLKELIVKYW